MKLNVKRSYNFLLIISFVFYMISILTLRNETLMTFSLLIKLVATTYTAWALSSKILLLSSMLQLFTYILVFTLGTVFKMSDITITDLMFKQSSFLDYAYILLAVGDLLLIIYSARNAHDYFINRLFLFFAFLIGVLLIIELSGQIFIIPTFITVLSTIIEFSTYFLYSIVLMLDLLHDMKHS